MQCTCPRGLRYAIPFLAMMCCVEANEFNWTSATNIHFSVFLPDTAYPTDTTSVSPSNLSTVMGKSFVIDKCIVEGNELKIFFRIILRGYDVVGEEGGRQWLMGQVKNNEFEIDTVTYIIRILNQDTLYAAPLLMDSIPPKMEAILSADTLQLCFYFLHFSTTYDCGSRWDDAFLDGSMPFDEVFQIIRAYYKKYCPLDTIARVGINKYKIYLVKQTSKTRQGIINKSKTGRVQAPGSLYASANGKKISGKADHRAMQILLLKNRRILIMP